MTFAWKSMRKSIAALTVVGGIAAACTAVAGPPFGGPDDTAFAKSLWQQLVAARFVGPGAIRTYPYEGGHPHGDYLEFIGSKVSVKGREGTVLIKKNYYGDNIDDEDVLAHPEKYLQSITVMFRREAGYDPEDKNWFWVKYAPDGKILTNPKGMKLAGRVAKGKPKGCIACHSQAEGGDFVYTAIELK